MRTEILAYLNDHLSMAELLKTIRSETTLLSGVLAQLDAALTLQEKSKIKVLLAVPEMLVIIDRELKKITSDNWHIRQRTATHIPYLCSGEKGYLPLIQALQDKHSEVRIAAALSLAQLNIYSATVQIIDSLTHCKSIPWTRTLEIVMQIGQETKIPLISILKDIGSSDASKSIAIACLGLTRVTEAYGIIESFSNNEDKNIRIQVAKALGQIKEPATLKTLIAGMQDTEWEVRAMSAQALRNFSQADALSALENSLGDASYWVRFNCASSLMHAGDPGIVILKKNMNNQDRFIQDICKQMIQTILIETDQTVEMTS